LETRRFCRNNCINDYENLVNEPARDLDSCLDAALCRIRPLIDSDKIKVNGEDSVTINGSGDVKVEFNVVVDPNQLPITSYVIDWMDGSVSAVSGLALRDRPTEDNPFIVHHVYDYWELLRFSKSENAPEDAAGEGFLNCPDDGVSCTVKFQIKLRDNWGAVTCDLSKPNCTDEKNKFIQSGEITVLKRAF